MAQIKVNIFFSPSETEIIKRVIDIMNTETSPTICKITKIRKVESQYIKNTNDVEITVIDKDKTFVFKNKNTMIFYIGIEFERLKQEQYK